MSQSDEKTIESYSTIPAVLEIEKATLELEKAMAPPQEALQRFSESIDAFYPSDAILSITKSIEESRSVIGSMAAAVASSLSAFENLKEMTLPSVLDFLGTNTAIKALSAAMSPILLPGISRESIPFITHREERAVNLTQNDRRLIAIEVVNLIKDKEIKPDKASYPLPPNASVEKLMIKFFDGHTVKVLYPGMEKRTFDYKDMGFIDHKTHNPDTKWIFLREMADSGGSIKTSKYDKRFNRTVKYDTNKRLKKFFGTTANFFYPYTKSGGYKAKFTLLPEDGSQGINADNVTDSDMF